eukprot:scaffold2025_cov386-Prasinococcus_capsulatus_cf.AAC.4
MVDVNVQEHANLRIRHAACPRGRDAETIVPSLAPASRRTDRRSAGDVGLTAPSSRVASGGAARPGVLFCVPLRVAAHAARLPPQVHAVADPRRRCPSHGRFVLLPSLAGAPRRPPLHRFGVTRLVSCAALRSVVAFRHNNNNHHNNNHHLIITLLVVALRAPLRGSRTG